MTWQVWLLFFCSALMEASIVGQAVMAALIGHSLAEDKALSTLPVAIQMTATMAASIRCGRSSHARPSLPPRSLASWRSAP